MNVKLVAVTTPLVDGIKTAEELLVYTARVSNPSNQHNTETGAKLLRYCLTKQHWSVFEQAELTIEIETSRAIAAQILRHRSFTFQEFSQRYADTSELGFEFHEFSARRQDPKNRQNSVEDLDPAVVKWFDDALAGVQASTARLYRQALEFGISKECARFHLRARLRPFVDPLPPS
jgi:thymidylate synthase (FAD)